VATETISVLQARRLALARAGLLKPDWTAFPTRAGRQQRRACYAVIKRFGYLQLDTIPIAGARSHALFLMSRLQDLDTNLPESLLRHKAPLFEYWGHEASWIPMELYPVFAFRRKEYRRATPWWGNVLQEHRSQAKSIHRRIRDEGALCAADFDDRRDRGDWSSSLSKRVLRSLWWAGDLAVRERQGFQPHYDLSERVIPAKLLRESTPERDAIKILLLKALEGHGWASTKTLVDTWRLTKRQPLIKSCLEELRQDSRIVACSLERRSGWLRTDDCELVSRLERVRPRTNVGVLLSPFDPVLWDRGRVKTLFEFDQILEIFKPAHERKYGYYCMPVLAGDRLVARCDLKAERKTHRLNVLSIHHEGKGSRAAVHSALTRHANALDLKLSFDA
jgi:uncharacterized protein YcaQ